MGVNNVHGMDIQDDFREIFRRLETTDRHIVDIQNKMLAVQKGVDEKFNILNASMLKLLGSKNGSENGNQAWVRQSIGLAVAVVTMLGFVFTMMTSMVSNIRVTMESERQSLVDYKTHVREALISLDNRIEQHNITPWHSKAAIKITEHEENFKFLELRQTKMFDRIEWQNRVLLNGPLQDKEFIQP